MNPTDLTSRQRLALLLMGTAVIVVFAMMAGFIITSVGNGGQASPSPVGPVALASPVPSPSPFPTLSSANGSGISLQVQAARLFDQIAHQVETTRELAPRAEVPLSFLDEAEMTQLLYRIYSDRDPEAQLRSYTALGLLPDVAISVHAHQVAGVYVPEQEQLYIATGGQEGDADDQALLAHAYVHALQDQRFDLGAIDARATTTDARLAIQALIEGDATLLTALYRYHDSASADWPFVKELVLKAEQPDYGEALGKSEVWARLQRFPYEYGPRLADALYSDGGWDAVNRAYVSPPRSTEQVLHQERYLEARDEPAEVVVPDLGDALGDGWERLLEDTLGEFVAGLYLGTVLPEETAWQAVDGWDGDTFVVWESEDEDRVRVWRTVWDTTAEAAEFERALGVLIPQQNLPVRPFEPPGASAGSWWETDSGAVCVYRVARHVLLADAPDADVLAAVVAELP